MLTYRKSEGEMSREGTYWDVLAHVGLAACLYASPAWAQASLGAAKSFAVLGGVTVTNIGTSAIVGDVGVSPGSAVHGFPPGTVAGGTIHSNDEVAIQAQSDLTTAYDALAGQAFNVDLTGQDLGTVGTLTPGVYHFSSSAQLTGTLFLNALDNPNAVFIFQVGNTLTTASGASVIVLNGGSPCNVFWQVGSFATLGTTTTFAGNVIALSNITLTNGARIFGRALARNGTVTLDTNNVAMCAAACPSLVTTSPVTLPDGIPFTSYSQAIVASGGTAPYAFTVASGSLPQGLFLSSSGVLAGAPLDAGTFSFVMQVVDSGGCSAYRLYTVIINGNCPSITLDPGDDPFILPEAAAGTAYNYRISATTSSCLGLPRFSFDSFSFVGGAPPSLTLSSAGVISGTPLTPGTFKMFVKATGHTTPPCVGATCSGSRAYTLVVGCGTITVSPATLPSAQQFVNYSQELAASGGSGPYTYSVTSGSLPGGIALLQPGLLAGQIQSTGTSTFTVTAADPSGCFGSRTFTLTGLNGASNPIPTLSEWGLILLAGLLPLIGFLTLRKSGRTRLG
jgi:hypothetical protein